MTPRTFNRSSHADGIAPRCMGVPSVGLPWWLLASTPRRAARLLFCKREALLHIEIKACLGPVQHRRAAQRAAARSKEPPNTGSDATRLRLRLRLWCASMEESPSSGRLGSASADTSTLAARRPFGRGTGSSEETNQEPMFRVRSGNAGNARQGSRSYCQPPLPAPPPALVAQPAQCRCAAAACLPLAWRPNHLPRGDCTLLPSCCAPCWIRRAAC